MELLSKRFSWRSSPAAFYRPFFCGERRKRAPFKSLSAHRSAASCAAHMRGCQVPFFG
jgi:hypothetical protein